MTFCEVLKQKKTFDILFIPGGGAAVTDNMLDENQIYLNFLREVAPSCHWIGSVCTGAFLLAAAGLLDGCDATTYWSQVGNLALFPNVRVVPGYPRWVIDGMRRRFSGGGISSSIDLALELVQQLQGVETRQQVQLNVQYAPNPPLPSSGDPMLAPVSIVETVRTQQNGFVCGFHTAVQQFLGETS
jgi:cyclohexyl-isocyanide hydratase